MESPVLKDIEKILLINLGGIGDFLLSLPAVKALAAAYPEADMDILVVDRVGELAVDSKIFQEVFLYKNIGSLMALRHRKYDLAVNMRTMVNRSSAFKMRLMLKVIGAKRTAGRNTDGHGTFFDISIPETLKGDRPESEYDIATVEALGARVDDKTIKLDVDTKSADRVRHILAENSIGDKDLIIGIHPGGAPSHRWPVKNFAAILKKLGSGQRYKFVLTGDRHERNFINRLDRAAGSIAVNMAGRLNLRELTALINRCDLYISNDTGPIHIAAVLKRPLIVIFGPGYIKRYDPRLISGKAILLYKSTECAPCDRPLCLSMKCLSNIKPQEVVEAAMRFLESAK